MPALFYRNNQLFGGRHRRSIVINGGEHTHKEIPMEISRLLQLSGDIDAVEAKLFAAASLDVQHSRRKRDTVDHIGTVIQVICFMNT